MTTDPRFQPVTHPKSAKADNAETALALSRRATDTPDTPLPYKSLYARAGETLRERCIRCVRRPNRAQSERRRKRGGDGFNYREMMIALNPETAARIGLTTRSKTSPGLFDQAEHDPQP